MIAYIFKSFQAHDQISGGDYCSKSIHKKGTNIWHLNYSSHFTFLKIPRRLSCAWNRRSNSDLNQGSNISSLLITIVSDDCLYLL